MALTRGTRLGAFEIVTLLGAGGMGEVYRARDTRLGRDVAIKILPPTFTTDPDRLARFEREARVLASINHPNIATIHGVEESASGRAIVLELVDGNTLADRIARGPLSVDEARAVARQIADALDAAHEKGIVHRDLKPANVKITPDGRVKVLDFGLAKLAEGPEGGLADGASDALTAPAETEIGMIVGTAPYMSPEQARGLPVDRRTDIWAFGCLLYEMLAGRPAFGGATRSDTLAAILERDPSWAALPSTLPSPIVRLVRQCLRKDRRQRLRDIGDALDALSAGIEPATSGNRQGVSRPLVVAGLIAAAGWVAAGVLGMRTIGGSPEEPLADPVRFLVDGEGASLALSADGRALAWVRPGADGESRLWVRPLDAVAARELPGTEGATYPFWAPDARAIGFIADGRLKRVDVASGSVQVLANVPEVSLGGTWSEDNVIVFSSRFGLYQIPAEGGDARLVAGLDRTRQENSLRFPHFLPDGRHFLYVARSGRPEQNAAYVGSLDGPPVRLFETMSNVAYAHGHVLFVRGTTLVARPFDPATLTLGAETVPLADNAGSNPTGVRGFFAVSANGVLTYARPTPARSVTLEWFDRAGRPLGTIGAPAPYDQFRLSPDGTRVAAAIQEVEAGSRSVWILEEGRNTPIRFTFAGTHDWQPAWSPDGTRIAFGSYRDGPLNLYVKSASGSGNDEPLVISDEQKDTGDFSADGRHFAYTSRTTKGDVLVTTVSGAREIVPIARTDAEEGEARFAGDGRWIAYTSDETGRKEVFVQPFPPTGAKWQVSVGGGQQPAWRGDGRELFYLNDEGMLLSVAVAGGGPSPVFSAAQPLFSVGRPRNTQANYDVTRDGKRFLVAVLGTAPPLQPTTVIVNWPRLLSPGASGSR